MCFNGGSTGHTGSPEERERLRLPREMGDQRRFWKEAPLALDLRVSRRSRDVGSCYVLTKSHLSHLRTRCSLSTKMATIFFPLLCMSFVS